eukprot:3941933-Rhodomonas_salina.1
MLLSAARADVFAQPVASPLCCYTRATRFPSGTELRYAATGASTRPATPSGTSYAIPLRVCYAMSSTVLALDPTNLCTARYWPSVCRYAMSGTDLRYAAASQARSGRRAKGHCLFKLKGYRPWLFKTKGQLWLFRQLKRHTMLGRRGVLVPLPRAVLQLVPRRPTSGRGPT